MASTNLIAPIVPAKTHFADTLSRVMLASEMAKAARVCLLSTRDRDHALNAIKEVVAESRRTLYRFTVAGRERFDAEQLKWTVVSREVSDPHGLLQHAGEIKGGGVVVFEDCVLPLRDESGDPRMRMLLADLLAAHTTSALVLVFVEPPESAGKLPSILADRFVRLQVDYPRFAELEAIARAEVAMAVQHSGSIADIQQVRAQATRLAYALAGLTRSGARDALRDALAPDPRDFEAASSRLQARKRVQLSHELAMNVLDTADVETPIGLDYLVEYLSVGRERMRVTGDGRARGILLIGPPGTGKTMLARAIGHLVDLPVIEFRISALMNSLLGATEQRFAQAFATLEAMSPNVVFIDEIEKAFGDSSERDGGTMMRCTGSLLSWLSDNPNPNFIVATSNSLQRMGEIGLTMTRAERFDASFFVDVPSRAAREAMLTRWLQDSVDLTSIKVLAQETDKFSGADLRSAIKQSVAWADHHGQTLSPAILRDQIRRKQNRALALYDEFTALRRWGRVHCDPAGPSDD